MVLAGWREDLGNGAWSWAIGQRVGVERLEVDGRDRRRAGARGKCHRIFRSSRTAANERRKDHSPTTACSSLDRLSQDADIPQNERFPCRRAIIEKPWRMLTHCPFQSCRGFFAGIKRINGILRIFLTKGSGGVTLRHLIRYGVGNGDGRSAAGNLNGRVDLDWRCGGSDIAGGDVGGTLPAFQGDR